MKIVNVETLHCLAGWRPWTFLKIETDEGITGYSECSESFGSTRGIVGCIQDLKPQLIGRDPLAFEKIYWDLFRLTRQSWGGVVQKALGGIENALLDIKGKVLGVPVCALFGGPVREKMPLYWSHCGTTRARNWKETETPAIRTLEDIRDMGKLVRSSGYTALKTNLIFPGDPPAVLMQGFRPNSGEMNLSLDTPTLRGIVELVQAFREGAGEEMEIFLDLNFHFRTEGNLRIARALEDLGLGWLEVDTHSPESLQCVQQGTALSICSGECLYTARQYRPFFERQAMRIASVDVMWNGFHQAKKIADMAETFDIQVAPHNHYSPLSTLISLHYCAAVSNARILEVDVDDVPWRDSLITESLDIRDGHIFLPQKAGWGADLNEEILSEHPWS